jgi:uncharacterized protein
MREYELLLTPLFAWFVAQAIKFAISLRKDGLQLSDLYVSGGFPSSHTSFIVSITALIGLRQGLGSDLFAALVIISGIVMYDSVGVRRSNGQLVDALNELTAKQNIRLKTHVHKAKGHTPLEVFGGIATGLVVAIGFYFFA